MDLVNWNLDEQLNSDKGFVLLKMPQLFWMYVFSFYSRLQKGKRALAPIRCKTLTENTASPGLTKLTD
jgi:hypothetical protein